MLRKIILLLLISVLAYVIGSYLWSKWTYLLAHVERFSGVAIGSVLFVGLWGLRHRFTIIQNWLTYFGTRIHESAHEKMAFLSGRRLFGYNINHDGSGHIVYECDGSHSPLITLAPYFFSYSSLVLLAMRWVVVHQWLGYYDVVLGFLLAFHTYAFLTQTRLYQTDLQKIGVWYSCLFIPAAHVVVYGLYLGTIGGLAWWG